MSERDLADDLEIATVRPTLVREGRMIAAEAWPWAIREVLRLREECHEQSENCRVASELNEALAADNQALRDENAALRRQIVEEEGA